MSESLDRPAEVPELTADELQSRVLHRDGLMLVIDKPAGLPVHRGPKGGANLESSFESLRFGLPRPPVLAHRLDRDTSGCLVLGRHRKATASLRQLIKHRKIGKTNCAEVEGGPADHQGNIEKPLALLNAERGTWQKQHPEDQKDVNNSSERARENFCFKRIKRQDESQESIGAKFQQHTRQDHRTRCGRLRMRIGKPSV